FSFADSLAPRRAAARRGDTVSLANWGANLDGGGTPRGLSGVRTAADGFEGLGVRPAAGRALRPADDDPRSAAVAMISYAVWREQFCGDPGDVGRTVRLHSTPHEVAGSLPRRV